MTTLNLDAVGLWRDVQELPDALNDTIQQAAGVDEVAGMLGAPHVRRIVATGNGAAYYVAQALWLASLSGPGDVPVVAVPSGLVARGRFPWRVGDVLVAISSSGEFRDLVEAVEGRSPGPYAAITATPESTVGAAADARALFTVVNQRAVTHTQVFCGAVATALCVWAALTGDAELQRAIRSIPDAAAAAVRAAERWWQSEPLQHLERPRAAVVFGSGPAWAAASEASLLLKEVAAVPAEGAETREGATSGVYAFTSNDLALSLPTGHADPLLDEAEDICRATGATVLRTPVLGQPYDPRLAAVLTMPACAALAIQLAHIGGLDIDRPSWTQRYYSTARYGSKAGTTEERP